MDVHDTASVARNIPLQAGVTFTVEPGKVVIDCRIGCCSFGKK